MERTRSSGEENVLGRTLFIVALLMAGVVSFDAVVSDEIVPVDLTGSGKACMGDICDGINEVCKIAFRGRDCVG